MNIWDDLNDDLDYDDEEETKESKMEKFFRVDSAMEYKTLEDAIKGAQKFSEKRHEDFIVSQAIKIIKYPTPTFEVADAPKPPVTA